MTIEDQYRMLVGAYYGVREMDEYEVKVFILDQLETYIKEFISVNPIPNFDYEAQATIVEDTIPLKRKLQDALLVLPKIKAPLELILLIKERIQDLNEER